MIIGLFWLLLPLAQDASVQPLGASVFQLARDGLTLTPQKQAILINPEGTPVEFRFTYEAPVDAEATFRAEVLGPSLSAPLVVSAPGPGMKLSISRDVFSQEGIYQLVSARLEKNGQILAMAEPQTAEIQVAEKFVVTQVEVEELSRQDLLDLGYSFNENDYFSVNFKVAVNVETKPETVNVNIPIAFPRISNSTFSPQVLSDPFNAFTISPIMLPSRDSNKSRNEPELETPIESSPLIGLILIPGNFKFLKAHFGVTCILLNSAPEGFDVKVENLLARLKLPVEPVISINEPVTQVMVNLGPDGQLGTADDSDSVFPGEEASARYIVTGDAPGIHNLEIVINGDLLLPQGREQLTTSARGTLYVRSPEFSVSFEHPDAVEAGETYELAVLLQNRGEVALEDFSTTLDPDALQGVELAGTHPVQSVPIIPPGGEVRLTYQMRSLMTGKVLAGYYKERNQPNSGQTPVQLSVAVGNLGQRPSPYVLHFPQVFFERFGTPLADALRNYAKKALDVGLTADQELPSDLDPLSAETVRKFNRLMVWAAKGSDYGMTEQESLVRLLSLWSRSLEGHGPLDKVRRKVIHTWLETGSGPDVEAELAARLISTFPGTSPEDFLTFLTQELESLRDLSMILVDADAAVGLTLSDSRGRTSVLGGRRGIPFTSIFPLSPTRTLMWVSDLAEVPTLKLTPTGPAALTARITAVFPGEGGHFLWNRSNLTLTGETTLGWDASAKNVRLQQVNAPLQTYETQQVPSKPFQLISAHQVPIRLFEGADYYGRHHAFFFSKPLDLSSLEPLEEHLSINGEPISFAELQQGGRLLIASSKMPLGPYHPIRYRLEGARSKDGQLLGLQEGTYQGSADYKGVYFSGKIADRNGTDITKARVFLWLEDEFCVSENECERVLRIVHTVNPGGDGRFQFNFAPLIPDLSGGFENPQFQKLRLSVVLEDGRYEVRDFRPLGPGQEIFAEFAFLQLGEVFGQVTTETGEPVAFQKVFVTSQENSLSGALTETDALGNYRVDRLEVGPVLVKSAFQNRIALTSSYLTQTNSPLRIDLVISQPMGRLQGVVSLDEGNGPQPLADVYVGFAVQGGLVTYANFNGENLPFAVLTQSLADGSYALENAPAGNGQLWFYHPDYGVFKRQIFLPENETGNYHHTFQQQPLELSSVAGIVQTSTGVPVAGARVVAGSFSTTTNASGTFFFEYLRRNQNINLVATHPDLGRGSFGLYLDQAVHTGVTIVLQNGADASGLYLKADGEPVAFRQIYFAPKLPFGEPKADFTALTQTEFNGSWQGRVPVAGEYTFSAYQPPLLVESQTVNVGEAGVSDIVLRQVATADLKVKLVKTDGEAVVAKVDVLARVPSSDPKALGVPTLQTVYRDVFTDAEGFATFTNLNTGEFQVFGHLNSLGETDLFEGILEPVAPGGETRTVTLVFPDPEVPANLFGNITEADGTPAPAGTLVTVQGEGVNQYALSAANGTYRFENLELGPEPRRLRLLARNPETGHFASALLSVNQDLNLRYDLVLARTGTAHVRAVGADEQQVDFAEITVVYDSIQPPSGNELQLRTESQSQQVTPENPVFTVAGIPTGQFVVRAVAGNGFVGLRSVTMPLEGGDLDVTVMLEAASSISGVFINGDDPLNPLPLGDAEIQLLRNQDLLQQKLTSSEVGMEGRFFFGDLPMRNYRLYGVDPSTARKANLEVFTSPFEPNPDVVLALDPIASVTGLVTYNGEPVPNATLTFRSDTLKIVTGTDIEGRYLLTNLPLGAYQVTGIAQQIPTRLSREIALNEPFVTQIEDLAFGDTKTLELLVLGPDGNPAPQEFINATRTGSGISAGNSGYTDANGRVILPFLQPGSYRVTSENPSALSSLYTILRINSADPDPVQQTVQLSGWGTVSGFVRDSLGNPLESQVQIQFETSFRSNPWRRTITTQTDGFYRLGNVPQGLEISLTAFRPQTGEVASAKVTIAEHLQELGVPLTFASTTSVSGRVTYADGSPAPFVRVSTSLPVEHGTLTDYDGFYTLAPMVEGEHAVVASDTQSARQGVRLLNLMPVNGTLEPVQNFEIQLSGVAQVAGLVTYAEGQPVRLGRVTLVVTAGGRSLTAPIQGDGSFVFPQLPLGEYSLQAYDSVLDYLSPQVLVEATVDGANLNPTLVFEPDFVLDGVVYAADRTTPVPVADVSLWRRRDNGPIYDRIYETQSLENGSYALRRVFPGEYLIKASSEDATATFQDAFLMPNLNRTENLFLAQQTWLAGVLTDAAGKPFSNARVTLYQGGIPQLQTLSSSGAFRFDNLAAGAYLLEYTASGSWYQGSASGILQPGANTVLVETPETTLSVSGQAILAKTGTPGKPSATLRWGNSSRSVPLAADGGFIVNELPEGEAFTLELRYQSSQRSFALGPFAAPVGVDPIPLGSFYLDAIPPVAELVNAGQSINALPHRLEWTLTEDEPQSDIDVTNVSVWVNGVDISSFFTATQTSLAADFDVLPTGFLLGMNSLKIKVYNTSNTYLQQSFPMEVALSGTTLVVRILEDSLPVPVQVRLNDGAWQTADADGRLVIQNLAPGPYRFGAKGVNKGLRGLLNIDAVATQNVTWTLANYGEYRGQVLDADGQPVANVRVQKGADFVMTDANGNYIFDLLPYGRHELTADAANQFGWIQGPNLTLPKQTLLDVDLQLYGRGSVTGTVFDGSGTTPLAGIAVSLDYQDLPNSYNLTTTTEANGAYQFADVLTLPVDLTATEPATNRRAYASGTLANPGDTLVRDMTLTPTTTLTGAIVGLDSQPIGDWPVALVGTSSQTQSVTVTTETDALGKFQAEGLLAGSYRIRLDHEPSLAYLNHAISVSGVSQDAGTLQLQVDQPPFVLAHDLPALYDPRVTSVITVDFRDDRQLATYVFSLSGAYSFTESGALSPGINSRRFVRPNIPGTTAPGDLHYRLEVRDSFNQLGVEEGTVQLGFDTLGPSVALTKPSTQVSVLEGTTLQLEATASDYSGINRVEFFIKEALVGSDSQPPYRLDAQVPSVPGLELAEVRATAYDRFNNASSAVQTIEIQPLQSAGSPEVTLLSPIPDVPLPLWLASGLNLQIAFDASDSDGLGAFRIYVDDTLVFDDVAAGTQTHEVRSYLLPEALRTAEALDVRLEVEDLGGNTTVRLATVHKLEGEWLEKTATDPLNWATFYVPAANEHRVLLNGGEHIIDGVHEFDALVLVNGATLTQTASTSGDAYVAHSQLALTEMAIIDYGSQVDVSAKGRVNMPVEMNLPYHTSAHAHGGLGRYTQGYDEIYGSPVMPTTAGSFRGGGAFKLEAPELWVIGDIHADTRSASKTGSGGSVWLIAPVFHGCGTVTANAWTGTFVDAFNGEGGGGGRVAIWGGPFAGTLQAHGGSRGGPGSVYTRIEDAAAPRGYRDLLHFENHPAGEYALTTGQRTTLLALQDLEVGVDVFVSVQVVNNQTRQVLEILNPAILPTQGFLGAYVYATDTPTQAFQVHYQAGNALQYSDDRPSPTPDFVDGQRLNVAFRMDRLQVGNKAWMHFRGIQPESPTYLVGGRTHSGDLQIQVETLDLSAGEEVELTGDFKTNSVDLQNGTLKVSGLLEAQTVSVGSQGRIVTPSDRVNASLHLKATSINLLGHLEALQNGLPYSSARANAHGGIGKLGGTAYGSPYHTETAGSPSQSNYFAGGFVKLEFESLNLDGRINVSGGYRGSAGGVYLQGETLTGNGHVWANGHSSGTAGGRIGIFIEDLSGFSGEMQAYSPSASSTSNTSTHQGAGTVFYRNSQWPLGRLVVDNRGNANYARSTPLPSLGQRTLTVPSDGTSLALADLPEFNDLAGVFIQFPGGEKVAVAQHDTAILYPQGQFPVTQAGGAIRGVHRLNVLEVRGKASLYSQDPIEITDAFVVDDGGVEAELHLPSSSPVFQDGGLELGSPLTLDNVVLDNFVLTLRAPLTVNQLTLRNGARLVAGAQLNAGQLIAETGTTIEAAMLGDAVAILADDLHLKSGATLTVADRLSNSQFFPLRVQVSGTLTIDPGATVTTSGSNKVVNAGVPWAGGTIDTNGHGGMGRATVPTRRTPVGSFAEPGLPGGASGGGVIKLTASTMILNGLIKAEGYNGPGGSIWLESQTLSGSGTLNAEPRNGSFGNGRIAIYYAHDRSFMDTLQIQLAKDGQTGVTSQGGAGTLFLKSASQTYGELIVDQKNLGTSLIRTSRLTAVTGIHSITLNLDDDDSDPQVIRDVSWNSLPPTMEGLYVAFEVAGTPYQTRITGNTHNSLRLADPVPAILPADTVLKFRLILDKLTLRDKAQFSFPGEIEASEYVFEGDQLLSIFAGNIVGLPNPLAISNRDFRLILTHPEMENYDVQLSQANLFLDYPITLQDVTLSNDSWIQHSNNQAIAEIEAKIDLTVRHLVFDATSGLDASERINFDLQRYGHGSPDSTRSNPKTYGSLFQPTTFGSGLNGGGAIRVRADRMQNGTLLATGSYQVDSGGSIWLDADVLEGTIVLNASAYSIGAGGGRVAVYSEDASAATLTTTAYGNGAGGTIYSRQKSQPFGHLKVLARNPTTGSYTNPIPAIAVTALLAGFSQSFNASENTTTLRIPGLAPTENFAAYHLAINGSSAALYEVVSSRKDGSVGEFVLAGSLPALLEGDTVQLALRLASLEVSPNTTLGPDSLLIVADEVLTKNAPIAKPTQPELLETLPEGETLALEQRWLQTVQPLRYERLELRAGARLETRGPVEIGTLILEDASFHAAHPHFKADQVVLRNSQVSAQVLNVKGLLDLDVTSRLLAAQPFQHDRIENLSYGGSGSIHVLNGQPHFGQPFGALMLPVNPGPGRGALLVEAGVLNLNGQIAVPGGALLIRTEQLRGGETGRLDVSAPTPCAACPAVSGGRMAVYAANMSQWQGRMEAFGFDDHADLQAGQPYGRSSGAGTVFVKNGTQRYGELHLVNHGGETVEASTALPGLGNLILKQAHFGGDVLQIPELPLGLDVSGLYLRIPRAKGYEEVPIVANTRTELTLAQPIASLPQGTHLSAALHLDRLVLDGAANLRTPDALVMHGPIRFGSQPAAPATLWARRLEGMGAVWRIENQTGGLVLDEAHPQLSLELVQSQMRLDQPLALANLTLRQESRITHKARRSKAFHRYDHAPGIDLSAAKLSIDETSAIDVAGAGYLRREAIEEMWLGDAAEGTGHGGQGEVMGRAYAYGSAFWPDTHGFYLDDPQASGAGRMHLRVGTLELHGALAASDVVGGSILVEADTLHGSGRIHANGQPHRNRIGTAGRIAIFARENLLVRQPQSFSPESGKQLGAGTVYLRHPDHADGTLIVRNPQTHAEMDILPTPIWGMGRHAFPAGSGGTREVHLPQSGWRYSVKGMHLVDAQTGESFTVVDQAPDRLILDRPLPADTNPGRSFFGKLPVNKLILESATLEISDVLAPDVLETAQATLVGDLTLPSSTLVGQNLKLNRLTVSGGLVLRESQLEVAELQAETLTLHRNSNLHLLPGSQQQRMVVRIAGELRLDDGSAIRLDGVGKQGQTLTSHGGLATDASIEALYDAPMAPILPGGGEAGGGALELQAASLRLDGIISARGIGHSSGGAVLIFAEAISGTGLLDVSGGKAGETLGGGGRVAIHTGEWRLFAGEIRTGVTPTTRGSIVVTDPTQNHVWVGQQFPLSADEPRPPLALAPAFKLPIAAIRNRHENQFGTVLEVQTTLPLADANGMWVDTPQGSQRTRILAVNEDRYFIQWFEKVDISDMQHLDFYIPVLEKQKVQHQPGSVSIKVVKP